MTYYDEISPGYEELHSEEQLKKIKLILDQINLKKTDTLLDVGCGTGFYLDLFDCDVTGVDPSEKLLEQYSGKHQVILGSAEQLDFPDNYFDIVMSITAIHNFDDIEAGLKEMKRVGKNKFAFSVLKRSNSFDLIKRLITELFVADEQIEEEKDIIFFSHRKN